MSTLVRNSPATVLITLLGLCVLSSDVSAQTAVFATETSVSTSSPCPSFCGGPGGQFNFDSDGGAGMTTSMSSLNNVDGDGQALAQLNGQVQLPTLKADAFSNAQTGSQRSSRVTSQAFGLQGFYTSGDSYTLNVSLSGMAFDAPGTSNEDGSVTARLMLIRDNDPSTPIDFTSDYGTMKFEVIPGSGDLEILAESIDGIGLSTLVIPPDGSQRTVTDSLTASDLDFNDLIYVWSTVTASGTRGGFGDSFSTLTMQFTDPSGLSSDPLPPIPEPSTLVLGLLALAAMASQTRRLR